MESLPSARTCLHKGCGACDETVLSASRVLSGGNCVVVVVVVAMLDVPYRRDAQGFGAMGVVDIATAFACASARSVGCV